MTSPPEHPQSPETLRLAYFHAPWCGVCVQKTPVVARIADDLRLPLEHWNIDEPAGATEAERRRIRTVPTLALLRGDRVPFRLVGSMITPENVRHLLSTSSPTPSPQVEKGEASEDRASQG